MAMTTDSSLMHAQDDIRIVPFEQNHLEGAWRLSQEALWPHRVEDWALNLSVSKGVVVLQGDDVVGTALCSIFGDVATLNMIIVDERMRGRGLGRSLMNAIIELAGDREMRLVATSDGLPLYEKLGFVAKGNIVQHQGVATAVTSDLDVRQATSDDLDMICEMDFSATGMSRRDLLLTIAREQQDFGGVFIADGGCAMVRTFGRGKVIGPVIAKDEVIAKGLIGAIASRNEGRFLRIDLPQERALSSFVEQFNLTAVGGGTFMTLAERQRPAQEMKTYALVSQALG